MKRYKSRVLAAAGLVASLLCVGSLAWACISLPVDGVPVEVAPEPALWPPVDETQGPVLISPNPVRVPVGQVMGVSGKGWNAGTDIQIGLALGKSRAGDDQLVQTLGSVTPSADGAFSVRLAIPSMPAGVYYLAARQIQSVEVPGLGVPKSISVQRLTPAEILPGIAGSTANSQTTTTLNSTTGQVWSGFDKSLPAGDTGTLDLSTPAQQGSDWMLTASILASGVMVISMAGYAGYRTRRQRIRLDDSRETE